MQLSHHCLAVETGSFLLWYRNEQNVFISLLRLTAQIIIHHYNPYEISCPTIYNVTGLSSMKSKLPLFESLITLKKNMDFMSVS